MRRVDNVIDELTSQRIGADGEKHNPLSEQGGCIEPFRLKPSADPDAVRSAVRLVRGR